MKSKQRMIYIIKRKSTQSEIKHSASSSIYGDANILREMCSRSKMKTRFPAVSLGFKLQCIIKPEIDMVYELGRIAFKRVSLAIYLHVMSTCWS